jgi:ribosomal protein L13
MEESDPDALVEAMAEILGKLAEEVAVDLRARLGRVNGEMNNVVGSHQRRGRREDQQAKNHKDATPHRLCLR